MPPTTSHAGHDRSCTFAEIDVAFASGRARQPVGAAYRWVPVSDLPSLLPRIRELVGTGHDRLLVRALKLYGAFAELNYVFANGRMLDDGVPLPPRFTDYAPVCAASLDQVPLLDQMRWDFK